MKVKVHPKHRRQGPLEEDCPENLAQQYVKMVVREALYQKFGARLL